MWIAFFISRLEVLLPENCGNSMKKYVLPEIRIAILSVILFIPFITFGQGTVTYRLKINGKEIHTGPPLQISYKNGIALLNIGREGVKEQQYINYSQRAIYRVLHSDNKTYTLETSFDSLMQATVTKDTATILGYLCHKAHLVIRSNSMDVWFTDLPAVKGSPLLDVAPYLGLVLKIVRNGSFEWYATNISLKNDSTLNWKIPEAGMPVDEATFQSLLIKSRYTSIPVFTDQQINFGDKITNPPADKMNILYRYSGGTVILKKIHLPEDFHGSIFASLTQYSNGDAYDRTGCVFVIPTKKSVTFLDALENGIKVLPVYKDNDNNEYQGITATKDYQPPVEIMRFFTPFGIGAYNNKMKIAGYHWADSVTFVQDVTGLEPLLQGDVWIGAYIGNYDKNGHTVSLKLDFYPAERGDDTSEKRWILPLFNTLNMMEMSGQNYGKLFGNDSLKIKIFLPENITNIRLRYISTGHGGWDGGDEFNPKMNTIFMDGKRVFSYTPWRTDCATFRLENPSSGNAGNGLSSSDYSRSGWCPGTTTNPVYIPLPDLKSGWHTFTVTIPEGKPAGSSFSFWNVSGVLLGEIKK